MGTFRLARTESQAITKTTLLFTSWVNQDRQLSLFEPLSSFIKWNNNSTALALAVITKYHRLGGLINISLFLIFGDWKPEIRVQAASGSGEVAFPGFQMCPTHCVLTGWRWCGAPVNSSSLSLLFSHPVAFNSLQPQGLQHARPPCLSLSPEICLNSCPLSQWCHPITSSSVVPFSSFPQSFPASGSFLISWLFLSSGQSIRASASPSVLPMNIQGWFPLGLTTLISLLSQGLSRVFSRTTV